MNYRSFYRLMIPDDVIVHGEFKGKPRKTSGNRVLRTKAKPYTNTPKLLYLIWYFFSLWIVNL